MLKVWIQEPQIIQKCEHNVINLRKYKIASMNEINVYIWVCEVSLASCGNVTLNLHKIIYNFWRFYKVKKFKQEG